MNVAIIGTGWGARVQVPAFRAAGVEVVALAGSNREKTERIAAELGVPRAFGDWRAVLPLDQVRLVSIVTPPDLHAVMARAALEAGKDVLCEKPTALDAAQAEAMLDAARARPAQLALIDHELRFLPGLMEARRLIAEGAVGRVRHVLSTVIGSSRADPNRPWNWWSDSTRGGGMLGAIGSHQIDLLRYLLGSEAERVAATLSTRVTERASPDGVRPVTSDDAYSLRLRFQGGTEATLEGSLVTQIAEPDTLTLYGDGGTLRWIGGRLLRAAPGGALEDISPPHRFPLLEGMSGEFSHATIYLGHALRAYLDGDRSALVPAATFEDGLRVQRTLDAARASHRGGGGYVDVPA